MDSPRIYTRTGDSGETSLADGSRVAKDSPVPEALGALDEANSHIGAARAAIDDARLDELLAFVQHRLFNFSALLAGAGEGDVPRPTDDDVRTLESAIDELASLPTPLRAFVLPAGPDAAARLHVARSVVRRAERRLVALSREVAVDSTLLAFVNRVSDLLFAAARVMSGNAEEEWDPHTPRP
ncbi:MAG: cob(I)yrinic acid a,c-diamide adenosyltransferase [Coriobacteriia bacterium]